MRLRKFTYLIRKDKNKGFTLIELLLVISIISLIGFFTTPFYSRFLTHNSVSNVVDQMAGQLRKAQIYSMIGRQNTTWGVKYALNKITLFAVGNSAFDESFTTNPNINITGFTQVIFSKVTGFPDSTPTIAITGNDNTKTLTINGEGAVNR